MGWPARDAEYTKIRDMHCAGTLQLTLCTCIRYFDEAVLQGYAEHQPIKGALGSDDPGTMKH